MIQEKEIRPDSHPADARLDRFDRDGFVVIEDALSGEQIHRYRELHRVIYEQEQAAGRLASSPGGSNRPGAMHSFGFVLRHPDYLELLDLPSVFPLVCDILGWNIYMYHCHIDQHPPVSGPLAPVWGWHQDGGRQNLEVDGDGVRPRLSVKAGYFLSDVSEPNRGNMLVVPGSHRWSVLPRPAHPERGFAQPRGAVPVCARPGTAVVFDRRLWHSRSDNRSTVIREALFMAYTFRWIRPRDEYPIDWSSEPYSTLTPVRRQLLGWGLDAISFWGLGVDIAPLAQVVKKRADLR